MDTRDLGFRSLVFGLGSLSIASLLLYFFGLGRFSVFAAGLLSIETVGLSLLAAFARHRGRRARIDLIVQGLWAGMLATLVYDVVRIPIAHSGIPVFKAISYFGTVMLGLDRPTVASEALGWAYHLSNGVSFGLMYAALFRTPGPVTALLWGLSLEGVMLLTPYAEVFGYQRDTRFLAITIGAHAAYGYSLYLALRASRNRLATLRPAQYAAGFVGVPMLLGLVAADSNRLVSASLRPSPPPDMSGSLYTVWDVPEPDRVVVMWVMTRFVDRQARFHVIQPFDKVSFGTPFDMPEATIRRHGLQSATEYLIDREQIAATRPLRALARMTNLTEVSPWMLAADGEAGRLAEWIRTTSARTCGNTLRASCIPPLLESLDQWYAQQIP